MTRGFPDTMAKQVSQRPGASASADRTGLYIAPRWLPGGHAQTIYAALLARRPRVSYRRERWDTPDEDFIDVDFVDAAPDSPVVALFHGLEGNAHSHYALSLMHCVRERGWRGAVVHFRSCSGELNRRARAYHSGDSTEINWTLRRLRRIAPTGLFAVGVSLGGNALLKWLGETGASACAVVDRAAAVSAPVELAAAGDTLDHGFNLIYVRHFLGTMKKKALAKLTRYPDLYDAAHVRAARTLRDFDDLVTAPLHGFENADDYWRRASSKPLLRSIVVPTLMINALDDPFLPRHALPQVHEVSSRVVLEYPAAGGHAGFVSGRFPGELDWLPQRVLTFFEGH